MARPPVVTAELIAGLRALAIAHNAVCPQAPAKLNDLKKVWIQGWRRAQGRRIGAEAAVDKHLKKLAAIAGLAASPRSIEVLAKAEFDESEHRRDGDGKFAPKGGGAPASYSRVRTPEQHRQAMDRNAGYRSANTQVIPETRGSLVAPLLGIAGGVMLGSVRGFRADKMPGPMMRGAHAAMAWPGARVAGAFAGAGRATGERIANTMRRAAGEAEVDVIEAAGRTRRVAQSAVFRGTRKALDWGARATLAMSRAPINAAKDDIARKGHKGIAAKSRLAAARTMGAFTGAAMPGLPLAYAGYHAGQVAGWAYDSVKPRRVEKVLALPADPRSVEALAKASPMAALRSLGSMIARRGGAKASLGSKLPKSGPKAAYLAGRRFLAAPGGRPRSVGVGAALGAGAGAAAGAGGAFGARRYYRDEDGKFTSKERDVGTVGAIAGAAALGALAGVAFVRGKNRTLSREVAERIGNLKAHVATEKGLGLKPLSEIRQGITRGEIKPSDVVLPQGMPGARAAQAASAKIANAGAELRDKIVDARLARYRAAAASPEAWQEHQVEERLRDSLAGLRGKMAFAKPKGVATDTAEWAAYQSGRKLLSSEPVTRTVGKGKGVVRTVVEDPIGDTIAAIRSLDPAKVRSPAYLAATKTGVTDFDNLTFGQKTLLVNRVTRADGAIAEFRAATQAGSGLKASLKEATSKVAKLRTEIEAGEKGGLAEDALSALRAAKGAAENELTAARAATKAVSPPTIRNPLGGQIEAMPEAGKLEQYLDDLGSKWRAMTATQKAQIGRVNADAVTGVLRSYEAALSSGTAVKGRVGRLLGRLTAPGREFASEAGRIAGDARAAASPRMKAAWEAAQSFGRSAGAKAKSTFSSTTGTIAGVKGWMKENPRGVPYVLAGLAGLTGTVDVLSDGKLNFRFDKVPDAYKHLLDKKNRPQAGMYFLNGGKDVAYVMTGRTVATKDNPATDVILSGTVISESGASRDLSPMMPLKMFLDQQRGGGNQGGVKGAVQLSGQDAKEFGDAIKALGGKVMKSDDEEDGYSFRAHDDNTQDSPAGKLLSLIVNVAPSKRSNKGDDFYTYLGSIFGENSGLLKESEMRKALFGGKRKDRDGNEKPYQGIFDPNTDAAAGYRAQDQKKLAAGIRDKIEKIPEPTDDQARVLRQMVSLLTKGHTKLSEDQANDLRSFIETRRASKAGGSAAPVEKASGGGRRAFGDTAVAAEQDTLKQSIGTIMGRMPGSPAYKEAQTTVAERLFKDRLGEMMAATPGASVADLAREARISATENLMEAWIKEQRDLGPAAKQAVKDYIASLRKGLEPTDLAKLMAASTALLAKADVPMSAGQRRQFEEAKIRRNPRGNDTGGEFAPKGASRGGPSKDSGQRANSGRPADGQRAGSGRAAGKPEQDYFEPVRLGGTVGGAVGAQAGWEIASRFLPGPLRHAGIIGRLAYRLGSTAAAGAAGQMGGEAAGRATYDNPRKAPGSFEPKNRSMGEEAARMIGSTAGSFVGAAARNPMAGFAAGVGGQLAGEELAAKAHSIISRHYGQDAASRASRALMPSQRPLA